MEGSTLCLAKRSITIIDNKSRFGFRRRSVRGLVIGSSSSCSTKSSQTTTATITASASASSNSLGLSRQRRAQNVQGEFFVDGRLTTPYPTVHQMDWNAFQSIEKIEWFPSINERNKFLFDLLMAHKDGLIVVYVRFHAQLLAELLVKCTVKGVVCTTNFMDNKEWDVMASSQPRVATAILWPSNIIDQTCIDCDTCRWMAPQTFTRVDAKSAVIKQPNSEEERVNALQALLSCPTSSIHTEKPPEDIVEVHKTFPIPINKQRIPGVYHCGYHSEKSYGATSYFIVHPEGNILVDSPRYTEKLARNIEMLGGARYMFLTHSDDVADHDQWSKRLMCDRILHLEEVEATTADVEMKLDGCGPWNLSKDFELIHTPGHTAGSVCLLYKPLKILFTGDHLFKNEHEMSIMEQYNKLSVSVQLNSVRKLLDLDFEWIIPGHGRRFEFRDIQEKNAAPEAFLALKEQAKASLSKKSP